jgi:hypothetical protein
MRPAHLALGSDRTGFNSITPPRPCTTEFGLELAFKSGYLVEQNIVTRLASGLHR